MLKVNNKAAGLTFQNCSKSPMMMLNQDLKIASVLAMTSLQHYLNSVFLIDVQKVL